MKQAELAGKKLALSSVNRGVALSSTCMFGAMFKNIGDSKAFFLRKEIARIKC